MMKYIKFLRVLKTKTFMTVRGIYEMNIVGDILILLEGYLFK